jgi:hypothetical protein
LEKSKNKNKKWHVFFLANQLYIIGKSKKNGMLLINGGSTFFLVSRFLNSNSLLSKKKNSNFSIARKKTFRPLYSNICITQLFFWLSILVNSQKNLLFFKCVIHIVECQNALPKKKKESMSFLFFFVSEYHLYKHQHSIFLLISYTNYRLKTYNVTKP